MISEAFNPSHSRSFWCNADREQSHEQPNVEARFWNLRGIQYQDR